MSVKKVNSLGYRLGISHFWIHSPVVFFNKLFLFLYFWLTGFFLLKRIYLLNWQISFNEQSLNYILSLQYFSRRYYSQMFFRKLFRHRKDRKQLRYQKFNIPKFGYYSYNVKLFLQQDLFLFKFLLTSRRHMQKQIKKIFKKFYCLRNSNKFLLNFSSKSFTRFRRKKKLIKKKHYLFRKRKYSLFFKLIFSQNLFKKLKFYRFLKKHSKYRFAILYLKKLKQKVQPTLFNVKNRSGFNEFYIFRQRLSRIRHRSRYDKIKFWLEKKNKTIYLKQLVNSLKLSTRTISPVLSILSGKQRINLLNKRHFLILRSYYHFKKNFVKELLNYRYLKNKRLYSFVKQNLFARLKIPAGSWLNLLNVKAKKFNKALLFSSFLQKGNIFYSKKYLCSLINTFSKRFVLHPYRLISKKYLGYFFFCFWKIRLLRIWSLLKYFFNLLSIFPLALITKNVYDLYFVNYRKVFLHRFFKKNYKKRYKRYRKKLKKKLKKYSHLMQSKAHFHFFIKNENYYKLFKFKKCRLFNFKKFKRFGKRDLFYFIKKFKRKKSSLTSLKEVKVKKRFLKKKQHYGFIQKQNFYYKQNLKKQKRRLKLKKKQFRFFVKKLKRRIRFSKHLLKTQFTFKKLKLRKRKSIIFSLKYLKQKKLLERERLEKRKLLPFKQFKRFYRNNISLLVNAVEEKPIIRLTFLKKSMLVILRNLLKKNLIRFKKIKGFFDFTYIFVFYIIFKAGFCLRQWLKYFFERLKPRDHNTSQKKIFYLFDTGFKNLQTAAGVFRYYRMEIKGKIDGSLRTRKMEFGLSVPRQSVSFSPNYNQFDIKSYTGSLGFRFWFY